MDQQSLASLWDNLGSYWEAYRKMDKGGKFGQYMCSRYIPEGCDLRSLIENESNDKTAYITIFTYLEENHAYLPRVGKR